MFFLVFVTIVLSVDFSVVNTLLIFLQFNFLAWIWVNVHCLVLFRICITFLRFKIKWNINNKNNYLVPITTITYLPFNIILSFSFILWKYIYVKISILLLSILYFFYTSKYNSHTPDFLRCNWASCKYYHLV